MRYQKKQKQHKHQIMREHSFFDNLKSFTSFIIFCIVMILNSSWYISVLKQSTQFDNEVNINFLSINSLVQLKQALKVSSSSFSSNHESQHDSFSSTCISVMQSFSSVLINIDHAQTSDSALQSVNRLVNFHISIVSNQYNMNLNDQNVDDESVIAV